MKAAIFDMDGTLLDSMDCWRSLNLEYVLSLGITPTKKQREEMYNLSGSLIIPYLKREFGVDAEFEPLLKSACTAIEAHYRRGLPLKPGAKEYLLRLRARGVKCVLATATPARQALVALNLSGLTPHLDYIFSTEMIGLHKNSVEFYDALCAMIGEEKRDCVMFEDALYAMQGARNAGLGVIGITDATNELDRPEIIKICDQVIDSYDELA